MKPGSWRSEQNIFVLRSENPSLHCTDPLELKTTQLFLNNIFYNKLPTMVYKNWRSDLSGIPHPVVSLLQLLLCVLINRLYSRLFHASCSPHRPTGPTVSPDVVPTQTNKRNNAWTVFVLPPTTTAVRPRPVCFAIAVPIARACTRCALPCPAPPRAGPRRPRRRDNWHRRQNAGRSSRWRRGH